MDTDTINLELEETMPTEAGAKARDAISAELQAAGGVLMSLAGQLTGSDAVGAIHAALRTVDPFEAVAVCWGQIAELRDYGTKRRSGTVKLGTHTLERELHPVVTFSVLGTESKPIRFTLVLDAKFHSVDLFIAEGRIVEVGLAGAEFGSTLRYKTVDVVQRKLLKQLAIPARHVFKNGGIALGSGVASPPGPVS